MKVKEMRFVSVDIGPLDAREVLPTAARKRRGMATVCASCGQSIETETFVAGFKAGRPNLILCHPCDDEG